MANTQTIKWTGEDHLPWTAVVGIDNNQPCIIELSYETNGEKKVLAEKIHPQYKISIYLWLRWVLQWASSSFRHAGSLIMARGLQRPWIQ